jgi:crooked neck
VYAHFEKQFGQREGIEDVIVSKRRFQYEEVCARRPRIDASLAAHVGLQDLKAQPQNYDIWFDYVRLEESTGNAEAVRDVYERAIAQVPPAKVCRLALFVALTLSATALRRSGCGGDTSIYGSTTPCLRSWSRRCADSAAARGPRLHVLQDMDKARQVYQAVLNLVPHKAFTFAKLWLLYAQFEIRQKDLATARKTLGRAIGRCPCRTGAACLRAVVGVPRPRSRRLTCATTARHVCQGQALQGVH